jgi:hypothetical protein
MDIPSRHNPVMVGGDNEPVGVPCATIVRIRPAGAREHGGGAAEIAF